MKERKSESLFKRPGKNKRVKERGKERYVGKPLRMSKRGRLSLGVTDPGSGQTESAAGIDKRGGFTQTWDE